MAAMAQNALEKDERNLALEHLRATQAELVSTVKSLSEDQLSFKPSEDEWSIAECVTHLAKAEAGIWQQLQASLTAAPDPSGRSGIEVSDEQILTSVPKRDRKVSTIPPLVPNQSDEMLESLKAFETVRSRHIDFLETTKEDLRNRYYQSPYGKADVYQMLLFLATHTERHIHQINEVKGTAGFPNS